MGTIKEIQTEQEKGIHSVFNACMFREKRLAAGVLLERDDLVAAFRLLNDVERRLMKRSVREVKDAVIAEQVAIELEQLGIKGAA